MPKLTNIKPDQKKKKAAPRKSRSKSNTHIYILIIMALSAVILILLNYNLSDRVDGKKDPKQSVSKPAEKEKEKISAEKKDVEKKGDEKETPDPVIEKKDVKIYLLRMDEKTEKVILAPVARKIESAEYIKNTFAELLKGPSSSEKKRGLLSALPENMKIKNIAIKNRVVEIDFNAAIESGGGANILLSRLDQIIYTATQFEDVDGVSIKINGKPRKTLGGEGVSISGVLKRRQN